MFDSTMPMHGERELPYITLREIDLPGVLTWEVNSQHYLVVKVEMVGKRNVDVSKGDRQKTEGDFQVLSIKALGDKPIDARSLERADFENVLAKARSSGKI